MILRSFLHQGPVAISYLFGCGSQARAAVVDPVDSPDAYLRAAAETGMRIEYVVDTHVHADHRSTGPDLAAAAGARYVLHKDAGASYPHLAVDDGDVLLMGNTSARVLHTPGHTPEHISLLVVDRTRGDDPWFVLTGHTLMVGDMGRTELASSAEEGARALFRSALRLRELPDHVEVLPGAFSGSVCGRGLSGKPFSTIGFERRHNRAFSTGHEADFVALMTRDVPPPPPDAQRVRAWNQGMGAAARPA